MNNPDRKLALVGALLIVASGLVSIWIGVREGFMQYQPDPGGVFGHVGVIAGLIAVVIGGILTWIALHEPASPVGKVVVGLSTVVLGHLEGDCRRIACRNGWYGALLRLRNLACGEGREEMATVCLTRVCTR